jgi:predicted membrane protein
MHVVLGENVGPPCSPGVYIGAAGLALAGIALIAYFAGRERSRTKVFVLVGAGLISVVLLVTGVELKLREEHEVVRIAAVTEVVCSHEVSTL